LFDEKGFAIRSPIVNCKSKEQLRKEVEILNEAYQQGLISIGLALRKVLERHPKDHNIVAEVMTLFWAELSSNFPGGVIDEDTLEIYCNHVGFDQVTTIVITEKFKDLYELLRKYKGRH